MAALCGHFFISFKSLAIQPCNSRQWNRQILSVALESYLSWIQLQFNFKVISNFRNAPYLVEKMIFFI